MKENQVNKLNEWMKIINEKTEYIRRRHKTYETAYTVYDKLICSEMKNYNNANSNNIYLLDAGCGWRNNSVSKCLNKNIVAVGADVDKQSLKENISYEHLVLCNLEFLPFKNNTFSIITNKNVLEHLEHPTEVFKEFNRSSKENCTLLFLLPNILNPLMILGKITSTKLHKKMMKLLLKRNETDIFNTFFKCNSINRLDKIANRYNFKKVKFSMCGDFTMFIFNNVVLNMWILYDIMTNFYPLQNFKMLIVVKYKHNYKGRYE